MKRRALFPGTFNPPTLGHLDIIRRASKICDELHIAIALNTEKEEGIFNPNERKAMILDLTKDLPNVEISSFTGLVVDYAKTHNIDFIVRGLRAFSDFEYEFRMALANRKLTGIETVFLMADQGSFHISSSLIKEIGGLGHRLNGFVPDEIEEIVYQRLVRMPEG